MSRLKSLNRHFLGVRELMTNLAVTCYHFCLDCPAQRGYRYLFLPGLESFELERDLMMKNVSRRLLRNWPDKIKERNWRTARQHPVRTMKGLCQTQTVT